VIKIASIVAKEFKIIIRDPFGFLMLFLLPAIFILVLSVALQGAFATENTDEKFGVLLVNPAGNPLGDGLKFALELSGRFTVVTRTNNRELDEEKARELVKNGDYSIAISIPNNTDEAILLERDETLEIITDPVLSAEAAYAIKSGVQNFVSMLIIEALSEKGHIIQKVFDQHMDKNSEQYKRVWGESTLDPGEFVNEFETQTTNYLGERGLTVSQTYVSRGKGETQPNEIQQNVPGWTVFALFWIAQMLALNIVTERQSGTYKRILVAPIRLTHYLVGKTVPFLIINLIQAVFMFAIGMYISPLLGCAKLEVTNVPALALITVTISFTSIGFGLFMASLAKSDAIVASVSAAVLIIMCVIGGVMVPKFVMPSFMQKMSLYVPQGWAVDGYQDIIVRNYTTAQVLPTIGALLAFAAAFFIIGIARLHLTEKSNVG
jgi:ABC-2 type transport system permease protein